jgi:hypothetical protein
MAGPRILFVVYLALIVTGLALAIAIGAAHR